MAAATCNSYLAVQDGAAKGAELGSWVPSNSDFKQSQLAYLLSQVEDTWGTSIHHQWHNGSPSTSIQFESCM